MPLADPRLMSKLGHSAKRPMAHRAESALNLNWRRSAEGGYIESMADRAKRRWYQFSLKALLIFVVVASVPLGAYVARRQLLIAKRLAEIENAFQWLESLD